MRLRVATPREYEPGVLLDKPRRRIRQSEPMPVQPPEVIGARLAELRAHPERRLRLHLLIEGYLRYRRWPVPKNNPFEGMGPA